MSNMQLFKKCVWGGGDISDYPELQLFDFSISTTHTHTHAHSTVWPSKTQLLDKLIINTVRDPQAWGPGMQSMWKQREILILDKLQ